MKQTVNFDDFQSCYRLRSGHFTCDGQKAFSNHFADFKDGAGNMAELGPIAIYCEWKQYFSFREFKAHQRSDFTSLEELKSKQTVIHIPSGGFIVHIS